MRSFAHRWHPPDRKEQDEYSRTKPLTASHLSISSAHPAVLQIELWKARFFRQKFG